MNVKKIIAGILSCTTAFSMSVFYNSQPTFSADSYYIVGDESTTNESLDNVIEVADLTISTETTTTEIQTTEPIETTVVEETTITSIAETTTETTTTYIVGDADENGKLNVRDAAFIAKALARKEADTLPKSADYNIDGKIDVRDAAAIARHLASRYSDEEEPVVTSVSNDISVGVTTSTHIAHYRPTESCTCVVDEDTILCPLCGIPMDCTCGLDVTTTTVSDEGDTTTTTAVGNEDDITTTTAFGNEDVITTVQTAETINTLPVETTVATTNTTTTTAESTTTTTTTAVTTVTETVSSTTTPHVHNYVTETEIVEHEAEYETKTIWSYIPNYYTGNQWMEDANVRASDRYVPESGLGWYSRITDYDLATWYFGDGTFESILRYRDVGPWNDPTSEFYLGPDYYAPLEDAGINFYDYRDKKFFNIFIDKNNFTEYGLTEEQWYDVNYMQKKMLPAGTDILGREMTGKISTFDRWGNKNPTFNPELDVLIDFDPCVSGDACEASDGLDGKESNYESILDRYMPVAQEKFLVNDAWTEIVTHEVCECGHVKE